MQLYIGSNYIMPGNVLGTVLISPPLTVYQQLFVIRLLAKLPYIYNPKLMSFSRVLRKKGRG